MSGNLVGVLQERCPLHLRVLHATTNVAVADDTVLQPDVLVVARAQIGPERIGGGRYVEVAHVQEDSSWTAALPFPVTITPADLLS
ncbi:hypothetical protein BN10_460062 [Phycicoccus elongatus Lp2]|uniref:Uncharacterized protein n=1 Tax=Phycicoccus elongatus Lp2 TaxID=1193181 RepID=N0E2F2_9MICO|nr:hypothetical protein [Phycicoccus elongatus]CCH69961.1 hypothetical protein BN10_460062 [Phycicoccus elongatus Lp2]